LKWYIYTDMQEAQTFRLKFYTRWLFSFPSKIMVFTKQHAKMIRTQTKLMQKSHYSATLSNSILVNPQKQAKSDAETPFMSW